MKTQDFFNLLQTHSSRSLLIEYKPGYFVKKGYHITEVKHVSIESVDCGSGTDQWNETLIQLWENPVESDDSNMTAFKALSILKKVGQMKPYDTEATVKIEYSNPNFHISQLFVDDYEIREGSLILKLSQEKTDCKAKEACGIAIPNPIDQYNEPCCSPDSGCC